jgi:hypothetical protein
MGVCLLLTGYCVVKEYYLASFLILLVFDVSFQLSQGCIAWVYCSEVPVDEASGFVMAGQFVTMLVLSLSLETLFNGPLQIHGTFYVFGISSFFGAIFVNQFIRESKGLTDR